MALVEITLKSQFFRRDSRVIPGSSEQRLCLKVDSLDIVVSNSRWP
jgi:hypothetical protein